MPEADEVRGNEGEAKGFFEKPPTAPVPFRKLYSDVKLL